MKKFVECESPMLWDHPIDGAIKESCIELIAEALKAGEYIFPRKARPENSVGRPRIVGFGDGAFPSFGGCVYLVWQYRCDDPDHCAVDSGSPDDGVLVHDDEVGSDVYPQAVHGGGDDLRGGHFSALLVLAKARVSPLNGYTIPRSELSAGMLTSRMLHRVVKSLQTSGSPPFSGIMLLDSECTISSLETSSSSLKPFFQNRRAEIIDNLEKANKMCPMEEVHWVSTDHNIADILTRGEARLEDIGPGSAWLHGPTFFLSRRRFWPVHRNFVRQSLPVDELKNLRSLLKQGGAQDLFHHPEHTGVQQLFRVEEKSSGDSCEWMEGWKEQEVC